MELIAYWDMLVQGSSRLLDFAWLEFKGHTLTVMVLWIETQMLACVLMCIFGFFVHHREPLGSIYWWDCCSFNLSTTAQISHSTLSLWCVQDMFLLPVFISPVQDIRIFVDHVTECMHAQTGAEFVLCSEGVEGRHPCSCAGRSALLDAGQQSPSHTNSASSLLD